MLARRAYGARAHKKTVRQRGGGDEVVWGRLATPAPRAPERTHSSVCARQCWHAHDKHPEKLACFETGVGEGPFAPPPPPNPDRQARGRGPSVCCFDPAMFTLSSAKSLLQSVCDACCAAKRITEPRA
eukprot:351986-Chlamydomonas_euryale.AAC.2